jgi:hypothetical protein
MIGAVIGLILLLVLLGVVWWGIQQLLPLVPMGEPFATIVRVLLAILLAVIVIYVIIQLLALAGVHVPMWR